MNSLARAIAERGVTRVCHFTPFRSFLHILPSQIILSSQRLKAEDPGSFKPTDLKRYDGRLNHICASIEYPNVFYLNNLEATADMYPHYAVLLIRSEILMKGGVLFSPRNAAAGNAFHVGGVTGFNALYQQNVVGKQTYSRGVGHPAWLPTDMQAEVLIPDSIPFEMVQGVAVRSRDAAQALMAMLRGIKVELGVPLLVSPDLFDRRKLTQIRTGGSRPIEELFTE